MIDDDIYNCYMQRYNVFLAEDIQSFDWDEFFDRYHFEKHYIVEAVECVADVPVTRFNDDSYTQKYIVKPTDELVFDVSLNLIRSKNKIPQLEHDLMNCRMFIKNVVCDTIKQVLDHVESAANKYICDVSFVDARGNTHTTGEANKYAFYVVRSIENIVERLLMNNKDVCMMTFASSKIETKRHQLYLQILKRTRINSFFKNILEDTTTNSNYNLVYALV